MHCLLGLAVLGLPHQHAHAGPRLRAVRRHRGGGVTRGRGTGSAAYLQQLHQPLLANVQLMQHDERLGRAADASHQARGRGPRALRLLRQLVPTGGAVHVPEWLGRRSAELGPGSTVLESGHRAIKGKHSHNDDEDDEDKEESPSATAQLRLSGEHSWRARSRCALGRGVRFAVCARRPAGFRVSSNQGGYR